MRNFLSTARKHFLNLQGKRLDKKYVVFESDDWGSERIPSKNKMKSLASSGIDVFRNPFNYLDSLETEDDLSALFETLLIFRDSHGNPPVITANSVTANPDFEKIEKAGFSEYFYETILETYERKKKCANSFSLIKEGISMGIYHPQFHGREHLNVKQWLTAILSGNELLLKAFKNKIYAIDIRTGITLRDNFTAAFDGYTEQERDYFQGIIEDGIRLFKNIFGFYPKSFIAPCYIWHPFLEKSLKDNGIRYIQGLPVQLSPANGDKYRRIHHYQGQKNHLDQRYFIRNCFFEPAFNPRFDYIKDIMYRLQIIFFHGKPAIIGTHRLNFIGALNENNRKKNLELLVQLLKLILETWPDVEFTTTDKLGEFYL